MIMHGEACTMKALNGDRKPIEASLLAAKGF